MSGIAVVDTERSYAKHIFQVSIDRIIDVSEKIKKVNLFFLKHLSLRYNLHMF